MRDLDPIFLEKRIRKLEENGGGDIEDLKTAVEDLQNVVDSMLITSASHMESLVSGEDNSDISYTVLEKGYYLANVQITNSWGSANVYLNGNIINGVSNQSQPTFCGYSTGLMYLDVGCVIRVVGSYTGISRLKVE